MAYIVERASATLTKKNEELCGDRVEFLDTDNSVIAVLSDGLGSGVKANILATMTSKIITTLLKEEISLEEVIKTLSQTLPRCKVRDLAYSTFSILQVFRDGQVFCIEFDNPPMFLLRQGEFKEIPKKKRKFADKEVWESSFKALDGDILVLISDGIVHAGIGGILNLGWTWEKVVQFMEKMVQEEKPPPELVSALKNLCNNFYNMEPGDDASVAVLKVKERKTATVVVGPPNRKEDDQLVCQLLQEEKGKRIVCGGTTSKLVAREMNTKVEVDLENINPDEPPVGKMEGVDLVTEGMLTLAGTLNLVKEYYRLMESAPQKARDFLQEKNHLGSVRLTQYLIDSHYIRFLVGRAINPAHQNPNIPINFSYKLQMVDELVSRLEEAGKKIEVEYF